MTSLRMVLLLVGVSCVGGASLTRSAKQVTSVSDYNGVPKNIREQMEELEMMLTTEDFVRKYGYPVETHTVTTEDGYLLTVHRIPGSPKAANSGAKGPILLMHGLAMASDCWVLTGPEKGLGFILADEGYDVWMGNIRGNAYSSKHVTLSPTDFSYYNFSLHEVGVYDLPAIIDHILQTTNQNQLIYVGVSLGGTVFFILTSTKPEYNEKIRFAVIMAPAAYLWNLPVARFIIPYATILNGFLTRAKIGTLTSLTTGVPFARIIYAACADGQPMQNICIFVYSAIFGFNYKELNTTQLPCVIAHSASGASVQLIIHYAQMAQTGRFQMYDPNSARITEQPEYDLSKISTPISIHYALNDFASPSAGVLHLSKRLKTLVQITPMPDKEGNHINFVYAIHARELIYNDLLALLAKY